jgi:putative PIN family toxin of toxin-antitoxin system
VRVFLDTNVLVSAFATRGLSADLLELVMVEHEVVTGRRVLKELERALRGKLKLPASRCAEVVELVAGEAAVVVEDAPPAECDVEEADRFVLGEAMAAGADAFITGDAQLVELGSVGSLRILTPRQLWELLRSDEQAGK